LGVIVESEGAVRKRIATAYGEAQQLIQKSHGRAALPALVSLQRPWLRWDSLYDVKRIVCCASQRTAARFGDGLADHIDLGFVEVIHHQERFPQADDGQHGRSPRENAVFKHAQSNIQMQGGLLERGNRRMGGQAAVLGRNWPSPMFFASSERLIA